MYSFNKKDVEIRMQKAFDAFEHNVLSVRSGRASPAFLENVRVEVYGSHMHLKEIASVSVIDNFTLSVKPFDASTASAVAKAIQDAGLGVNPIQEGVMIRVPLPKMNEERRKELVKLIHTYGEESKISIRNIRRDINDDIKKAEKDKLISEDDMKRNETEVQKVLDVFNKKIEDAVKHKSEDIMKV